jgi:hypothetical protein
MRKWLGLGVLAIATLSAIAYWHFHKTSEVVEPNANDHRVVRDVKNVPHDGDAEASEVIEPLIVDRGKAQENSEKSPVSVSEPTDTRVVLAPGMPQPPRPELVTRRMPYADEEEFLPIPLNPLTWILDPTAPGLGVFEQLKNAGGTEESEPKAKQP